MDEHRTQIESPHSRFLAASRPRRRVGGIAGGVSVPVGRRQWITGLLAPGALPVLLAVLLAGCGSSSTVQPVAAAGSSASATSAPVASSPGTATSGPGVPVPSASAPAGGTIPGTALKIVVNDGDGKTNTWTLSCDPPAGTHPNPLQACTVLAKYGQTALPPTSAHVMCSQIFGGSQTAKITGTWNGKTVTSALSRRNGCETARWKELQGLLPAIPGNGGAT